LRIKDVARVQLGAQSYDTSTTVDGNPAVGMAVFLQTGANALDVAAAVKSRIQTLKTAFPPDMDYLIHSTTTRVVEASIHEVVGHDPASPAVLVILVVFIFLQHWRANVDPDARRAGFASRHLRGLYALGIFDQHPDALRDGARDRYRRGRRYRGTRERRTA
jgi:hypothetical protein